MLQVEGGASVDVEVSVGWLESLYVVGWLLGGTPSVVPGHVRGRGVPKYCRFQGILST